MLHLGCVGNSDLPIDQRVRLYAETLHYQVSAVAEVIGIDTSRDVIDEYRRLGICGNVIYGDVQALEHVSLHSTFDAIIAGEIIEHLACPGQLLSGVRRFCTRDALLIVTTPNTLGLPNYIRFLFGRFREGAQHVVGFNEHMIQHLFARYGFRLQRLDTCFQPHARANRILFAMGRWLLSLFPKLGGTLFVIARYGCSPSA